MQGEEWVEVRKGRFRNAPRHAGNHPSADELTRNLWRVSSPTDRCSYTLTRCIQDGERWT